LKLSSIAVVLTALVIRTAPLCHADPVVLNGSFEDPLVTAPAGYQAGGGTDWTDAGGNVFLISNTNTAGLGTTPFGNQFLGIASPNSSDAQTIPGFLTGQSYVLDLFISDVASGQGPQLMVTITGAATTTGTFNATPGPVFWQEVQLPFTAAADGNITLSLIDSGMSNIGVDNVTIETVPEASTVFAMLLLSGALTLGALRRIRRSPAP